MKKRREAKIKKVLENRSDFSGIVEFDIIENCFFENCILDIPLENVEFKSCRFKNVEFQNIDSKGLEFTDVSFEHCDLSNMNFYNTRFYSVHFISCKIMGTLFVNASLRHILFEDCMGKFANFSGATMDFCEVSNCLLIESVWNETELKHFLVTESNFENSEFLHTPLTDFDFSTCDITGLRIDTNSLKRMVVNEFQAMQLSRILGIVIK